MTCINRLDLSSWRNKVSLSNANAMKKKHKYPEKEEDYFSSCLEYVEVTCNSECDFGACNRYVWVIRKDMSFDIFLYHYAQLWVKGSKLFINQVNDSSEVKGRQKNSVPLMRAIKLKWDNWNNDDKSLSEIANSHRHTFFCKNGFSKIEEISSEIDDLFYDTTGVYKSKFISQLFPDIAIPFDTESKKKIMKCGYTPCTYGNGKLRSEVQGFIETNNSLTLSEFRKIDNAPSECWPNRGKNISGTTTSISRIIDKLFTNNEA